MKKIYFIVTLFLILNCENSEYLLKNVEINDEETYLYIFPANHVIEFEKSHEKKLEKGILIDNIRIIKEIKKSWRFNNNNFVGIPTYNVKIVKSGKLYYSLWLNNDLTRARTTHGEFNFNPQKLFKYKSYFKPIIGYKIIIEDLDVARMFKKIIQINNRGYIPIEGINSYFEWEKYSGMTILKRKRFSLSYNKRSEFDQIIISEFDTNNSIKIKEIISDNDSDSWLIKVLSDSKIIIPKEYDVVEEYERFNDISFNALGLDKEKIEDLAKDNGIILKELTEFKL